MKKLDDINKQVAFILHAHIRQIFTSVLYASKQSTGITVKRETAKSAERDSKSCLGRSEKVPMASRIGGERLSSASMWRAGGILCTVPLRSHLINITCVSDLLIFCETI